MPEIIKTFRCPMCDRRMQLWVQPDDPEPLCPYGCSEHTTWEPGRFAIGTDKGKAIDITQRIVEEDFGVTNLADNQREGDIAYKAEPETREKREEKEKVVDAVRTDLSGMAGQVAEQAMKNLGMRSPDEFWGSGKGFAVAAGDAMTAAKGTVTPDIDPMRMLHTGVRKGAIGDPVKKFRPIAKG